MSEIDLYELTKQKYQAQLKLEALQYQERLDALKKISKELDNATTTHHNNLKQIKEIVDDVTEKSQKIVEKLEAQNVVNVDRESGVCLKNIFDNCFEILNSKFNDSHFIEVVDDDEGSDPFLANVNKTLQIKQQFLNCAGICSDELISRENGNSLVSDDTVASIISDDVVASSPI